MEPNKEPCFCDYGRTDFPSFQWRHTRG